MRMKHLQKCYNFQFQMLLLKNSSKAANWHTIHFIQRFTTQCFKHYQILFTNRYSIPSQMTFDNKLQKLKNEAYMSKYVTLMTPVEKGSSSLRAIFPWLLGITYKTAWLPYADVDFVLPFTPSIPPSFLDVVFCL